MLERKFRGNNSLWGTEKERDRKKRGQKMSEKKMNEWEREKKEERERDFYNLGNLLLLFNCIDMLDYNFVTNNNGPFKFSKTINLI